MEFELELKGPFWVEISSNELIIGMDNSKIHHGGCIQSVFPIHRYHFCVFLLMHSRLVYKELAFS